MVSTEEQELQALKALEQQIQFLEAIKNDDAVVIRKLLSCGVHPDSDIGIDCAPLTLAAITGSYKAAIALIEGGSHVNASDAEGETALSWALAMACNQYNEKKTSDEDESEDDDNEQLWYAVVGGKHIQVARMLLQSGAEADTRNASINDFFLACCKHGPTELVKLLLDYGADVNTRDHFNMTSLMYATSQGDVFKLLMDHGADVTMRCDMGITILDVLLGEKSLELAQLVVDHGGDVNEQNYYLTRAARNGEYEAVQFLLHNGVDPSRIDAEGETPLQLARYYGHRNIVRLIRESLGLPSVQKLEATRAIRKQYCQTQNELGVWKYLLRSFRTKNFQRDPKEIFQRSWWFANKVCNAVLPRFGPTAVSSWFPDPRFIERDRKDLFEIMGYITSFVLDKLRLEIAKFHGWDTGTYAMHRGYLISLGIAFDYVFELRNEDEGVFVDLVTDYYSPNYECAFRHPHIFSRPVIVDAVAISPWEVRNGEGRSRRGEGTVLA